MAAPVASAPSGLVPAAPDGATAHAHTHTPKHQRAHGILSFPRRGVTSRAPSARYVIRGIYDTDAWGAEDADGANVDAPGDDEWTHAHTHTFETAEECEKWVKANRTCTNPTYPQCAQIYTTLCDWEQVQKYLLEPLAAYRRAYPARVVAPTHIPEGNRFADVPEIMASLRERLDLPFHAHTCEESTLNTLRYLFFHMRYGIFVMIRDNKLKMFVPFVNKDFRNTWGDVIKVEEQTLEEYVKSKWELTNRREDYIMDTSRWWANGNIICNVESSDFWGDSYLPQLRDMLQTVCETRVVPDVEFFINKRDFPQLKRNVTEPYDFIYDCDDLPLPREKYSTYAPIASFFVGRDFADVPLVTTDDWETATGRVYPPHGVDYRSAKKRKECAVQWKDRVATAIFRGNSTGPGTTTDDNQRIRLAHLSLSWKKDPAHNELNPIDGVPYLDAGLVGWNFRDRKLQGKKMTFIKTSTLGIPTVDKVPMYAQMKYKYHIYADGHCAAMRYASMMPLGAVILKVEPYTRADSMWYFPLLRPYDIRSPTPDPEGDHIPVKADLSDLGEVISWCKQHDAECEMIAKNSGALYTKLIAHEGQIDYLQLMMFEMAKRFRSTHQTGMPVARVETLLLHSIASCPFVSGDWFDPAANRAYTETKVTATAAHPPAIAAHADTACECAACTSKREATAAREAAAYVAALENARKREQLQAAQAAAAAKAAAAATAARPANIATVAAAQLSNPKFAAAVAAAAKLAAAKQRDASGSGTAGATGGDGVGVPGVKRARDA